MTSLTHQELGLRKETPAELSLLGRLRVYLDRRQAYASLVALDDRLLADMGLQRATLIAAVFGPRSEKKPSLLAKLRQGLQKARRRRATIDALQALPDHVLADIGIERGLIGEFTDARLGEGRWPYEPGLRAPAVHRRGLSGLAEAVIRPLRQWNLSRHAAGQMVRIDAKLMDDIGYVKGDVDWVPEVLAKRRLGAANRNDKKAAAA